MAPSSTPRTRRLKGKSFSHTDTAQKAELRSLRRFRDAMRLDHISNNDLFKYTGISRSTGYRLFKEKNDRTEETRGRKKALSEAQIELIIQFFQNDGFEARTVPWQNVCDAANLDFEGNGPPSGATVQRTMNQRGWKKCIACVKFWTDKDMASKREAWARERLDDYGHDLSFYRRIRYSCELHFKFGWGGKLQMIRKSGQRYCPDCIQDRTRPKDSGDRSICLHAWACIGYGFKSPLVFYDGSVTLQTYLDQILKPYVGQWLQEGQDFILEEDGASGYGGDSDHNIVKRWKEEQGLEFFNCPGAPDLAPIENAWKSPKAYIHRGSILDEDALKAKALEGWKALSQSTINHWCDSVPDRLMDVVKTEGQ
ncbi:hypothetical protein F5Y19DRAFT_345446 [Xylariaceae sp. FL1651]|nr:hypothetical protein F5Y19DRAFT_345446 [Xylariaceae sp. FL1651]